MSSGTLADQVIHITLLTFSQKFLSLLPSMNANTPSQQYGPILNSLCSWGKAAEVLDLIKEWVAEGMNNFTHNIPQQPPVSLMVIKDLYRVIFMF